MNISMEDLKKGDVVAFYPNKADGPINPELIRFGVVGYMSPARRVYEIVEQMFLHQYRTRWNRGICRVGRKFGCDSREIRIYSRTATLGRELHHIIDFREAVELVRSLPSIRN